MPILAPIVAWILRVLMVRGVGLVVAVIAGLGLSLVSYKFAVQPFSQMIADYLGGAGAVMVNWLGFFGVDQFITIVLSAVAVKFAMGAVKVGLSKLAAGS